jgi:hypothetical protein
MALAGKQIGIKRVRDRDTLLWELYGCLEKSAMIFPIGQTIRTVNHQHSE